MHQKVAIHIWVTRARIQGEQVLLSWYNSAEVRHGFVGRCDDDDRDNRIA